MLLGLKAAWSAANGQYEYPSEQSCISSLKPKLHFLQHSQGFRAARLGVP
jgi:hypothetical protein